MPVPTRQPFSTKEKRAAVELVRAQVALKSSREQLKMNKRTLRLSHTTANPDVFLNGWGTLFMDRTLFIAHTVTVRCASKLITFRSADFASPGGKLSLTCGQTFPHLWANFPSPVGKLSLTCGQTFPHLWANFPSPMDKLSLTCGQTFPPLWTNFPSSVGKLFPCLAAKNVPHLAAFFLPYLTTTEL